MWGRATLAAVAVLGLGAGEAQACSLAGPPPSDRERFDAARAAVVVRITSARVVRDARFPYRAGARVVLRGKPGAGGPWLRLRTADDAACGIGPFRVGQRLGLLLTTRFGERRWTLFVLEDLTPARLRALARRT